MGTNYLKLVWDAFCSTEKKPNKSSYIPHSVSAYRILLARILEGYAFDVLHYFAG